jgi:hypothetical protein
MKTLLRQARLGRLMRGGVLMVALTASWTCARGQGFSTNTYSVSTEDFANPERGFYIQADTYASAPSPVPADLASYRINGKNSPGNTYNARISLLLRLFYLDTFVNAPISTNFLNSIQTDFDSIRAQGCKAVVRFAYNQDQTRPFNEPSKARILAHIAQLKPLLQHNADVIAVVQEGFIGAWGEGYYSDIFYTGGQATAQNWRDRADVLDALLDALPAQRMIQVRTPQMKQKYVYGPTAVTLAAPLSTAQAFTGSNVARIGFHNDCYLADSTDFGTFSDYDVGAGTSAQDISNLRNYLAAETRFAPMGGETCAVNPPTDDCASAGGGADTDMALLVSQPGLQCRCRRWLGRSGLHGKHQAPAWLPVAIGFQLFSNSGTTRPVNSDGAAIYQYRLCLSLQSPGVRTDFAKRGDGTEVLCTTLARYGCETMVAGHKSGFECATRVAHQSADGQLRPFTQSA